MNSNYTSYSNQSAVPYNMNYGNYQNYRNGNDDRFIGGGFLAPFLLGGITGGLLAPAFYPRPYYYRPYPYYSYPYYGPYYR